MQLLIGLGNPGRKYRKTRHNIGFVILDQLAEASGFDIKKNKFKAKFAEEKLFGKSLCLIKPQDFMNLSGEVVDTFWNYYKVEGSDVLVVHDDIDLPLGTIRFSFGSGHGGHNGIRSIVDWVYTKEFYRLRFGVGRPRPEVDPADYVLMRFEEDELRVVDETVDRSVAAIETFYTEGPKRAMELFNN